MADEIHSTGNQAAAATVFGKTQKSNVGISYTSTSKLDINGKGYAQIGDGDANDGEVFDNFNLFLTTSPKGFTAVEFSIQYASEVLKDLGPGLLTVSIQFLDDSWQNFAAIEIKKSGLDDYQVLGTGNEVFKSLRLTSNIQFDMIKQSDITLAAAVPEPTTWMMMLFGFGLIGSALRRRKTTPSFA